MYVFAVIEHGSRRIRILGATAHPAASWVVQAVKNLVMDLQDAGCRARFLIRDRDGKYPEVFDTVLKDAGIEVVLSGVRMPRMNSIMDRWVQTCRRELLDRTLPRHHGLASHLGFRLAQVGQSAPLARKCLSGQSRNSAISLATPEGVALAARCRALTSPNEQAEDHFTAALGHHEQGFERSRTHLLYGEWLCRRRRRTDARRQLRTALEAFEKAGATPWADRARAELRGTGEVVDEAGATGTLLGRLTPRNARWYGWPLPASATARSQPSSSSVPVQWATTSTAPSPN
jgi:hypothetical protein